MWLPKENFMKAAQYEPASPGAPSKHDTQQQGERNVIKQRIRETAADFVRGMVFAWWIAMSVAVWVFFGFVLWMLASSASAQERYTAGLHLATWHDSGTYNDRNPGVYLRTPAGWTAGTYHNSHRRQSVHAGRTWSRATAVGDLSITAGAVTGYARPLQPLVVPSLRVWHVRLTALPKADPKGAAGVHLSIEF